MDSIWSFRSAYNNARKLKESQDAYCAKAEAGLWESVDGDFPENFQWEMLVDVLRGRVKVQTAVLVAILSDLFWHRYLIIAMKPLIWMTSSAYALAN